MCAAQVETLAKQVMHDPVEVQVGGRSVVNKDIHQSVELRPEGERFLRLLEILGQWCERGKVLIFVQTQDQCDNLFRDLLNVSWPDAALLAGTRLVHADSSPFICMSYLALQPCLKACV